MAKVYGYSDDLVEIEALKTYPGSREIDCYAKDVRIQFTDGTAIRIGYGGRPGYEGSWWIELLQSGRAKRKLTTMKERIASGIGDHGEDIYSDLFEIDAEIDRITKLRHKIIKPPEELPSKPKASKGKKKTRAPGPVLEHHPDGTCSLRMESRGITFRWPEDNILLADMIRDEEPDVSVNLSPTEIGLLSALVHMLEGKED